MTDFNSLLEQNRYVQKKKEEGQAGVHRGLSPL
jgi:hypothetical protein